MTVTHRLIAFEHPIKSVTILKSAKAEVVRTFTLDLLAGENKIEISGLSSVIDTDSARVSGLSGGVRLFDVVCTIRKPAHPSAHAPAEVIRLLIAKRKALESEKRVREHEADILVGYGKSLSGEHVAPAAANSFLDTFVTHARRNLEEVRKLDEEMVRIDRDVAKEREKMSQRRGEANGEVVVVVSAPDAGNVHLKVTYIVNYATWEPTYDLHAATEGGQPGSAVTLHYRARITQSTGEDWRDTVLTLSTSSSDMARGLPVLKSVHVKPVPRVSMFGGAQKSVHSYNVYAQQQQQQQQQQPAFGAFGQSQMAAMAPPPPPAPSVSGGLFGSSNTTLFGSTAPERPAADGLFGGSAPVVSRSRAMHAASESEDDGATEEGDFEEVVAPEAAGGAAVEPTTVVSESPLSMTYTVDGRSSVPSDGVAHQVLIASLPFEASVTHVAVPRAETVAYLQCQVKNTSEYRLLPGPVSVFLDESFVSKTEIHDINKGDTFACTLGADTSVQLTFVRTTVRGPLTGGAFTEQQRTTTCTATCTVRNTHSFGLRELVVRDSLPLVRDDKRARVVLKAPAALAEAKDGEEVEVGINGVKVRWARAEGQGGSGGNSSGAKGTGEKEGKMEWVARVEKGAEIKLVMQYEVRSPADLAWIFKTDD